MSFFDYINPFSDSNPLSPITQARATVTSLRNPRQTMAYLEDRFKHPSYSDAASALFGAGQGIRYGITQGQADADRNRIDYNGLTDQDLYRMRSTTERPGDNPFEAQNYDRFTNTYGERHSPRVYASDNSFVYPTTEPVHPNTADTSRAQGLNVVGGGAPPQAPANGSPEVTGATGIPGQHSAQTPDTVAKLFSIPSRPRRRSATQVG